ncbi:MAG: hypothetical protein JRC92_10530, partial [Deltaproteobacteria bacterium]|nr:hypothetical protein [Deltaproteobacteria bacterium]
PEARPDIEDKVIDVTRPEEEPAASEEEPIAPKEPEAELAPDEELAAEQERRKEDFGIKESLDAVVKETETIKVGDEVVDMEAIIAQVRSQEDEVKEEPATAEEPLVSPEGQVKEEDITEGPPTPSVTARIEEERPVPAEEEVLGREEIEEERIALAEPEEEPVLAEPEEEPVLAAPEEEPVLAEPEEEPVLAEIEEEPVMGVPEEEAILYGIHVVRPGENLWNIHFAVLREYLGHHGLELAPTADEPSAEGRSSGVARILKYAEKMVYIYNVETGCLTDDLDVIQPNHKIVIFNLTRLDMLLRQLDLEKIKSIHFDGTDLTFEG